MNNGYAMPFKKKIRTLIVFQMSSYLLLEYFTGCLRGCACASTCTTGREKERRGWHLRNSNIYLSTTWHSVHGCLQVQPRQPYLPLSFPFAQPYFRTCEFILHIIQQRWHSVTKRVTEGNRDSQQYSLTSSRHTFELFLKSPAGFINISYLLTRVIRRYRSHLSRERRNIMKIKYNH